MRHMLILACCLFAISCATPYQEAGIRGGYSELQLKDDVYQVWFKGNGYVSAERVGMFALYRGATIAIERGYEYFAVVDGSSDVQHSVNMSPVYSTSPGNVYGGQVYNVYKPSSGLTIKLLNSKGKANMDNAFHAETLRKRLEEADWSLARWRYKEERKANRGAEAEQSSKPQ